MFRSGDNEDRSRTSTSGTKSSRGGEVADGPEYAVQSPFTKKRQGTLWEEVARYVEYDHYFFRSYSIAVSLFFLATALSFHLGRAGYPEKDPVKMKQFITTIQSYLEDKSMGLVKKLASIKSATRGGFLKLYRYHMFEHFKALDVKGLAKALDEQSKRIDEIFSEALPKPNYTCETFKEALDDSWTTQEKHTIGELMDRAVKMINESGVLPFYVALGENKDATCLEFSPAVIEAMEHDRLQELAGERTFFCPATKSGTITGVKLTAIAKKLPIVNIYGCSELFLTAWNDFVATVASDAPPHRRPLFHAMLFDSIKHTGLTKAPIKLVAIQSIANWALVARDKCAFSALKAIVQTGMGDSRFTSAQFWSTVVLESLDKLAERSRLGACEEVFVNLFMQILIM